MTVCPHSTTNTDHQIQGNLSMLANTFRRASGWISSKVAFDDGGSTVEGGSQFRSSEVLSGAASG